jgi:hypothetical protein
MFFCTKFRFQFFELVQIFILTLKNTQVFRTRAKFFLRRNAGLAV